MKSVISSLLPSILVPYEITHLFNWQILQSMWSYECQVHMILFFKVVHLVLKAVCKVHWSIIYPSKKSLFWCFRIWIHTTPGTAGCDFWGVFLLMFVQKSFLTFRIKKRTPRQNFWTACSTFCHCGGHFHSVDDTWTNSCHF